MNRDESLAELLALTEKLGLPREFDSGLLTVSRTTNAEPYRQQEVVKELVKCLPELRRCLELRVSVGANSLVGATARTDELLAVCQEMQISAVEVGAKGLDGLRRCERDGLRDGKRKTR
jgi:hypothetical protein